MYLANDWGNKGLAALGVGAMWSFLLLGESHRAVGQDMEVHYIVYIASGRNCDWDVAQRALWDDAVVCSSVIIVARVLFRFPVLLTKTLSAVVALEGQKVDGVADRVAASASSRQQFARLRGAHCDGDGGWRMGGGRY